MVHETVQRELYKMMARRFPYSPAPEDLKFTVQVMVDDLLRHGLKEGIDTDRRLIEAFGKLGLGDKWPTPRMVIDALPYPRTKALPAPEQAQATNTLADVNRRARELGIDGSPERARELFLKHGGKYARLIPIQDDEARKEREAIQNEDK